MGSLVGLTVGLVVINLTLLISVLQLRVQNNYFNFGGAPAETIEDYDYTNPFDVFKQTPIDIYNASAIFNTVQSVLKEKDSNLKPNGVSFIPAYIPPNTRFYHSRGSPDLPLLFEWIAMDYEFSYLFANSGRKRRARKGKSPDPSQLEITNEDSVAATDTNSSLPFLGQAYLFTLRTTRPLTKLILLDGASAAKSSPKMDQQMILSRQHNTSAPVNERRAADKICKWGEKFGLQGIIRLEVGFEIIICDFHKDLQLISNVSLNNPYELLNIPEETFDDTSSDLRYDNQANEDLLLQRSQLLDSFDIYRLYEWIKAGSISDQGENRIFVDFSSMITPLNKTFIDPNPFRRNISYIPTYLKEDIILGLERNLHSPIYPFDKTNWQTITENIVFKFAPMLSILNGTMNHYVAADIGIKEEEMKSFGDDLIMVTDNLMRRYADETHKDWALKRNQAINDCILDYVYHTYTLRGSDYLIYASIFKVQYEITELIYNLFELARDIIDLYYTTNNSTINAKSLVQRAQSLKSELIELLDILDWSVFYDCNRKCNASEVCYAPTWGPSPFGWGPGDQFSHKGNYTWFNNNGEFYSIDKQLKCVSYEDVKAYRNSEL